MNDDRNAGGRPTGQVAKDERQDRLKLALRENLKRRKSQARERADFMSTSPATGEVARSGEDGPDK